MAVVMAAAAGLEPADWQAAEQDCGSCALAAACSGWSIRRGSTGRVPATTLVCAGYKAKNSIRLVLVDAVNELANYRRWLNAG